MFLKRKGQSTAEYAITLGVVIAVAAGVMSVALKGGMRQKGAQARNALLAAGNNYLSQFQAQDTEIFSSDFRTTTVAGGADFVDHSVMQKDGRVKSLSSTRTDSVTASAEMVNAIDY